MKLKQSTITLIAGVAVAAMTALLVLGVVLSGRAETRLDQAKQDRVTQQELSADMRGASTLLTNEVRAYAVTADQAHLDNYWREITETKTRDRVVAKLRELGATDRELAFIEQAKAESDALIATETRAMKLVLAASGLTPDAMPPAIGEFEAPAGDAALSTSAKLATARRILFDQTYSDNVANIMAPTEQFERALDERTNAAIESADSARAFARTILVVLAILIPLTMAGILWIFYAKVSRVIVNYRERLEDGSTVALEPAGTVELCALADAFNTQSHEVRVQLERNAELVTELNALVGEVTEVASIVSASSQQMASTSAEAGRAVGEIASAIGDVAQGAERQVRVVESTREAVQEAARAAGSSAESARGSAEAAELAKGVTREGADAADEATRRSACSPRPPGASARASDACRRSPSGSAASSPPSPASPSRPTCSRSTPPSRPRAPASRAEASPSSPRKSASSPRSPGRRRPDRLPDRRDPDRHLRRRLRRRRVLGARGGHRRQRRSDARGVRSHRRRGGRSGRAGR